VIQVGVAPAEKKFFVRIINILKDVFRYFAWKAKLSILFAQPVIAVKKTFASGLSEISKRGDDLILKAITIRQSELRTVAGPAEEVHEQLK
jgi:hypothetical protein